MISPAIATTVIFVALCALIDVRSHRIPNVLSGAAVVCGLALNAVTAGTNGLTASLAGIAIGGGLLVLPFALGGVGAGDVKMMAAVGALLGPKMALVAGFWGIVFGGVLTSAYLLGIGRFGAILRRVGAMARAAVASHSTAPLRVSTEAPGAIVLPYAVPLGLGTLFAMVVAR